MLARAHAAGLVGIEARLVEVQVDLCTGIPQVSVVGLPETAVRESKERVRAAVKNSGHDYPARRITINLAPAAMKKEGTAYDLAIAVAILSANGVLDPARLSSCLLAGELALDGRLAPIRGALPLAAAAHRAGLANLIVPTTNANEAALVDGISVFGATTLTDVIAHLDGTRPLSRTVVDRSALLAGSVAYDLDLADVRGQHLARRALEIAAAGGHNVLMIGPPGTGKTMLARRLPGVLPPLLLEEALQTTAIHSVTGVLKQAPLVAVAPFRAPHHTISHAGLVGGGINPRPGEVTLAHNGVLFLDELPEFSRASLEALREPLETASITVARAAGSVMFPTDLMLVAAMNPCPCGHFGNPQRSCTCVLPQIARYRSRISGPLLDRIDLHVEVPSVPYDRLAEHSPGEPSVNVRGRVAKARDVQRMRFCERPFTTNARMGTADLRSHAALTPSCQRLLATASLRLGLSARGFTRIVKVARTIADLDESPAIQPSHLAEAIQYRSLDRPLS